MRIANYANIVPWPSRSINSVQKGLRAGLPSFQQTRNQARRPRRYSPTGTIMPQGNPMMRADLLLGLTLKQLYGLPMIKSLVPSEWMKLALESDKQTWADSERVIGCGSILCC